MNIGKNKIIIAIILLAGVSFFYFKKGNAIDANSTKAELTDDEQQVLAQVIEKEDRIEKIEIVDGSTYGNLMKEVGIDYALAMEIYDASSEVYDLVKIRVGRFIELVYDKDTDLFKELRYKIDTEEELFVKKIDSLWSAELLAIKYETRVKSVKGIIESSLYQAALDSDIDIRAVIELANAFQWSVDFAMDPRVGDTFKFIYEERYLDGEYVMPGQVLAGIYVNAGEEIAVYYFEESEDNIGYFDIDANSVQKMFLKAPVAFKYISSGFTTGSRYVAKFDTYHSSHMAIDYAAAAGTPIRAVGDGVVTSAGWNSGGYGYLMKIRHNSTYSTNYAHCSGFAVKTGTRVKQGQVVAYVGNTGFSTGPHLHYEMVKNGAKVNPLREILPPGKPIKDENKERFFEIVKKYKEQMK
jgi:murein DD-endopeptidase MepM/ murein hydrolase activator NlpD